MCIDGTSPGPPDYTSWERKDVFTETVIDVSSDCPTCSFCKDVVNKYMTFPTVRNRTAGYRYSSFAIASTKVLTTDERDVSECLDAQNRFVTFMVVSSFSEKDAGTFHLSVTKGSLTQIEILFKTEACK